MSENFNLEIVNPEKSFLSKENVSEVVVPAFEGEIGILKDHIPIISFLKPGIIKVFIGSEEENYFVEDGIAKRKKVNLIYKGSGFILVDGNISENDLIIITRMPDNFSNQKVTILN